MEFIIRGSLVEIVATFVATDGSGTVPTSAQISFTYYVNAAGAKATVSVPLALQSNGTWTGSWNSQVALDNSTVTWEATCAGPLVAAADGSFDIGDAPSPPPQPPGTPTQSDFLATFVRGIMGITPKVLPDGSPAIAMAFLVAVDIVNLDIAAVAPQPIYQLAVYNLAGSNLINYATDQPGQTYFADLRTKWNINGFVSGVIQSSGDVSTNQSLVVQEAAKNFTIADLQYLKDPYGRQYLSFAQRAGTLWGIT